MSDIIYAEIYDHLFGRDWVSCNFFGKLKEDERKYIRIEDEKILVVDIKGLRLDYRCNNIPNEIGDEIRMIYYENSLKYFTFKVTNSYIDLFNEFLFCVIKYELERLEKIKEENKKKGNQLTINF